MSFRVSSLIFSAMILAGWSDFEPTDAFRDRQQAYLDVCAAASGPGSGRIYGQICRLAADAGPLDVEIIRDALVEINAREDTADFELNALLRMLAFFADHPEMQPVQQEIVDAALNFKYWLDEPGDDMMCWWSENHQVLFHTAELVAGQLFPDTVFSNSGMTGSEHVAHAIPLLQTWLSRRGHFGFSEWHSNVYFNEDMPALVNLVDLANDETIATEAAMVLDLISFDFANNYFQGVFATTHGRTYEDYVLSGRQDSTAAAAWVLLNLGTMQNTTNFSGSFLATSPKYYPPPILEHIAADCLLEHEHRQRDSITVAEGPEWGIGYQDYEDVMFWWGMGAYVASSVIEGTFYTVDYYDLWDNYFWSDVAFLQPLVGAAWLEPAAVALDDFTRGSALEAISTYIYRTPYYQLSGAQDFNPGLYGAQQHIWQATLDPDAVIFTSWPGGMDDDYAAGAWTGGWLPRAQFYRNVGVIQYQHDLYPVGEAALFIPETHAHFPIAAFDETAVEGSWIFGRKGEAYVALYSWHTAAFATASPANEYELIAEGPGNVWIVELGSRTEHGDFSTFVSGISRNLVSVDLNGIQYWSLTLGPVETSWDGPFMVGGEVIDVGPYDRWDNRYAKQIFGSDAVDIRIGSENLVLDFSIPERTYTSSTKTASQLGNPARAARRYPPPGTAPYAMEALSSRIRQRRLKH